MHFLCLQFIRHTLIARLIFFKALLSSFYPLAQAFLRVLSIPSDNKIPQSNCRGSLKLSPASIKRPFSLFSSKNHYPRKVSSFFGVPWSLCCIAWVPPLCYSYVAAMVWSLLPSHSRFITECVGDGMACWQRARTSG